MKNAQLQYMFMLVLTEG